ncbi:MAG: 2-dehydropantoate 2-reductase [Enterocloster asparagiformis]|nr:2-dehydropantoate 2-reductase [Enterocloster asparagiformis]
MREIKTVSLIGLGAIGSFLAGNLQKVLGDDLRVIAGGARKERLERDGIVINGVPCRFHVVSPEEETGYADLAIFITKITGLAQAIEDMKRQIGPDTIIMAPLNGVESEERVAAAYGWERVLYSLARISVVMDGNQVSFNPSMASVEFGEKRNQELTERVQAVKALFERAGIRPVIQPDMEKALWMKFICNVSENQVGAVLKIPFGAWGASEHANTLRLMVAKEVIDIAHKKGIDIDDDYAVKHLDHLKNVPYANKPSTLQDIEHGRKTEVEMFAGTVIRLGKETGIPTPYNEFLYHAIHVLEEKNAGLI